MDAFSCGALSASRFKRPVKNFVKSHMPKPSDEWRISAKAKAFPPRDLSDPRPQLSSPSPSSDKGERKNHQKTRRRTQVSETNYPGKGKKYQELCPFASSDRDTNFLSSRHQSRLSDLSRQPNTGAIPLQSYHPVAESVLPIPQTVKRRFICAVNYRICQLANLSTRCDDTVSSYMNKMITKVDLQMEAHSFDLSNTISTIRFLAVFQSACDTNHINKGATMWVLPFFVKTKLASGLNSCVPAATHIAPIGTFGQATEHIPHRICFWLYSEVVNNPLKNLSNDQAIAMMDSTILNHTQPASMSAVQYAGNLYAKTYKVADFYD